MRVRRVTMRTLAGVLLAGGLILPAAARAEPVRRALVIGNADYAVLNPLPNTLNDAGDMGAALAGLGFRVTQARNADLAAFEADLRAFAASLRPGDFALVYFAGHGVTGRTAADASQTDSYLLPTDVRLAQPADVPQRARGLAAILAALDAARAGARLVILDACRDNPFASVWPAQEPGAAGGLVQPTTTSLRGALVAYATSPGEFAIENHGGRNGLFTQELLKRIAIPGTALSVMLADVSAAVEFASKGEQIPFFMAGDASAAALVMSPASGPAAASAVPDPLALDLRIHRQAVECGLAACLEAAALDVRDGTLRRALVLHATALRAGPGGAPGAVLPPAARPRVTAALAPEPAALLARDAGAPDGAYRIGRRFMLGSQGFPRDPGAAIDWFLAAAGAGSGAAAFELASAYHDGLPGVSRNRVEAYRWLVASAKQKFPAAYALGGRYRLEGWGAQLKNLPAAQRWFEAGVALGDSSSALELGKLEPMPDRKQALFRIAADRKLPEAMFRLAVEQADGAAAPDHPAVTTPADLALYKAAGEAGYFGAFTRLGFLYREGSGSVAPDRAAAIGWFTLAAERGNAQAMWALAGILSEGSPTAAECGTAMVWARRAAVAGDWHAVEAIGKGFTCPAAATPSGGGK